MLVVLPIYSIESVTHIWIDVTSFSCSTQNSELPIIQMSLLNIICSVNIIKCLCHHLKSLSLSLSLSLSSISFSSHYILQRKSRQIFFKMFFSFVQNKYVLLNVSIHLKLKLSCHWDIEYHSYCDIIAFDNLIIQSCNVINSQIYRQSPIFFIAN